MKRFYKYATAEKAENGFAVLLDGKAIKTPAGQPLQLPTEKLAKAIAAEWQGQGEVMNISTMMLMQLAATTIDHVALGRVQMEERLLAYAGTDLICHRTQDPPQLFDMQEKLFTPFIVWFRRRYDIALSITSELTAVKQPEAALQRLGLAVGALSSWALIGVQTAALASGSIVLALAMHEKAFTAEEVFEAAEVESTYQMERWGSDSELLARRKGVQDELNAIQQWFGLLD